MFNSGNSYREISMYNLIDYPEILSNILKKIDYLEKKVEEIKQRQEKIEQIILELEELKEK